MASMTMARNRSKLKEVYGLEVPDGLTYQGWEPGGTYTKSLILKNVKLRTQKIKFRISSQSFFCDVYPHPVVLSAGNSCTLPVTFRPVEKAECHDKVEITTSEGNFTLPLQAVLPKPKLELPSSIQLGVCEVQNSVNVFFNITNTGSISTDFYWECDSPFDIQPTRGTLPPKGSCKLQAIFEPPLASVYRVIAACHYGDKFSCTETIRLEGTGKYPYLLVKGADSEPGNGNNNHLVLLFGEVCLNTAVEKLVELINPLPVPATFHIDPESQFQTQDLVFSCSKTQGTVPPLGKLTIKVMCSPCFKGQCGLETFELIVKGGLAKTKITCKAKLIGPKLISDKTCINFGSISCDSSSFAYLCLTNSTNTPTIYQFHCDPQGVFQIDSPSGKIRGGATCTLKIVFNPRKPIPYHKSIQCLVLNQDPITVHLIGSAFSETVKPAQLSQRHVSLYKAIVHTGLTKLPPQNLLQSIEDGSLEVTNNGLLVPDNLFHPPLNELAPSASSITNKMSAYFKQGENFYDHLEVDKDDLQFGFVSPNKSSEGKILTITNLTQGTVVCSWITGQDNVFQVIPSDRELPPQSTGAFAISFWPKEHNNLFCKELECYVFYKALSDYTLVDPRTILPPWCVSVTATGHSFSSAVEPFQPTVSFNSKRLVLPSTLPDRASYRSFVVENLSSTPVLYNFEEDEDRVFRVKPSFGMMIGGSHNIFVAEMIPTVPGLSRHSLQCALNCFPKFTQTLELSGKAELPKLLLDREESVFFMPTCVGSSTDTSVTIANPCTLPIRFAWQIKGPVSQCLKISPRAGILEPNESLPITFTFIPLEIQGYQFTTVVTALLGGSDTEGGVTHKHRIPLSIYGKGTTGMIKCLNPSVNCGYVVIGTSSKVSLSLRNGSGCKLKFRVGVRQTIDSTDGETEEVLPNERPHGLEFSFSECEMEAFTDQSLSLTLRPSRTARFISTIFYQLILPHGGGIDSTYHDLCTITVQGAYPRLSVADVKGDGVACSLSKSQIWKMLQIQKINHYLCEDPSPSELRYTISTRHSTTRTAPVLTRAVVDFNFCPGSLSSRTNSTYYLLLSNSGEVEAEWAFKFPMDMYLEPEFWAETGQIDPKEQHEINVVRNSLFTIEPKSGFLGPGEKVVVRCAYLHTSLGTSSLPVLLKINRGREVMLNFTGVTCSPHSPCITLPSHTHTFVPMPLNSLSYPTQIFQIYNAGDVPGSYTIDMSPLEEMRKLNYSTTIIDCLNPQGSLPPGQTADIKFLFSPAEPKLYTVDLPIHFTDSSTEVVTFRGEGLLAGRDSPKSQNDTDGVQIITTITQPGQLAELSQAKILLSDVPIFAIVRYIIFIRNISNCTISYNWKTENNQVLSIHPSSGYLQPGRSAQLRLSFHSQARPCVYDIDIPCLVTNESEMSLYRSELAEWERLQEEKKHEFVITDRKVFAQNEDPAKDEETYEDWMKRDLSKKSKARTRKRKNQTPKVPVPPDPEILHLSVTGRTYSIPDYCKEHSDFDSFKIDYNSIITNSVPVEREVISSEMMIKVSEAEILILETVLAQFLRDLEKDSNFLNSLTVISNENIPYFSQFTISKPSTTATEKGDDTITKEAASRHVYASELERVPSVVGYVEGEESSQEPLHRTEGENGEGSGLSIGLPDPPPPINTMEERDVVGGKIKRSTEFQSFTELIVENVLLNIIKEVNRGELSLIAPVYTIAKPPL